jgi:hypothetical protein
VFVDTITDTLINSQPEDGDSTFLRNIETFSHYTAQKLKILPYKFVSQFGVLTGINVEISLMECVSQSVGR